MDERGAMTRALSNMDDVIDSRDVIQRADELADERNALVETLKEARETLGDARDDTSVLAEDEDEIADLEAKVEEAKANLLDWDERYKDELDSLMKLEEEGRDATGEFQHGEALIRYSYWEQYVQELLQDIGDLPKDIPHYIVIDWEATARNIAVDYTTVDFDGVEYYIRSS